MNTLPFVVTGTAMLLMNMSLSRLDLNQHLYRSSHQLGTLNAPSEHTGPLTRGPISLCSLSGIPSEHHLLSAPLLSARAREDVRFY